MDIWARYTRMFGGGAGWDTERGATYHASDGHGGTVCGRGQPNPRTCWELLRGRTKSYVTCTLCRRKLGLEPLED